MRKEDHGNRFYFLGLMAVLTVIYITDEIASNTNSSMQPYVLIALGYGIFIGGLWSVSDTMILVMAGESTPTQLRTSVYGANGLISGIGMLLGIVVTVVGINVVGSGNVGLLSLATTLPFLLLAMLLLMKNVNETNGQDLNKIGGK